MRSAGFHLIQGLDGWLSLHSTRSRLGAGLEPTGELSRGAQVMSATYRERAELDEVDSELPVQAAANHLCCGMPTWPVDDVLLPGGAVRMGLFLDHLSLSRLNLPSVALGWEAAVRRRFSPSASRILVDYEEGENPNCPSRTRQSQRPIESV